MTSENDSSLVWAARERLMSTSPDLLDALYRLGDEYGPSGVAKVANDLVAAWDTLGRGSVEP